MGVFLLTLSLILWLLSLELVGKVNNGMSGANKAELS